MSELENHYRDHAMGISHGSAIAVRQEELLDFLIDALGEIERILENAELVFAAERVQQTLGGDGAVGDADALRHLAKRSWIATPCCTTGHALAAASWA